jgi:hypothetical protein
MTVSAFNATKRRAWFAVKELEDCMYEAGLFHSFLIFQRILNLVIV